MSIKINSTEIELRQIFDLFTYLDKQEMEYTFNIEVKG